MLRLAMVLFSMVATTLAGIGVVVALVMGFATLNPILIAAVIGFLIAIAATWIITRMIYAA